MIDPHLEATINAAWEVRDTLTTDTSGEIRDAVRQGLKHLDAGEARVAEPDGFGGWTVNEWLKKAVLLSFRLMPNKRFATGPDETPDAGELPPGNAFDKVPQKTADWRLPQFKKAGFRMVPGALVRRGAYIAPNVVLMPSFVNIGAYVDEGTMVDTWATVGSCAQIGKNVHISGGAGIGGVLEPLQAAPVIIEDDCFIGARSEVAEGVIVRKGAVLSMGVFLSRSTKIVDRATGQIHWGEVPPYSVVVPGSLPSSGGVALSCAVIVKTVDEQTRSKTSINDLLRD